MAERIVSPGVFTRERDLSFLPQGVSEIGAAIIGPTIKGPAFVPTVIRNFQEYEEIFGSLDKRYYTPYTIQQYLQSAGTVTVVRVLGIGGYSQDYLALQMSSSVGTHTVAVLAPSRGGGNGTGDLSNSSITGDWSSATLTVSGSDVSVFTKTISFNTSSANYIENVISSDSQVQKSGADTAPVYLYKNFKYYQSARGVTAVSTASLVSGSLDFSTGVQSFAENGEANSWTGNNSYSVARTPYIQSQLVSGQRYDLFRIYTLSHGNQVSNDYKIAFSNIKAAGSIAGSDYGSFTLQVRKHKIGDPENDIVLEQWDKLTFDPTSTNYLPRVIGDRWISIDSNGKLSYHGDWTNRSNIIRIGDYSAVETYPVTVVPMGFKKVYNPVPTATAVPSASFVTAQTNASNDFDSAVYYGFDFASTAYDNLQYLAPIPLNAGNGSNVTMSLEDMLGHGDASSLGTTYSDASESISLALSHIKQRKFMVPFQWGFDGDNPGNPKLTNTDITAGNIMGFDCSSATASGSIAYKRAINAISNADEFDINLLVTPGLLYQLHPIPIDHGITTVEARADAFYIIDDVGNKSTDTVDLAGSTVSTLDTSYAATYYPWVKILDSNSNLPIWVPPSVVLPGIIAYTDRVAHEWFAPAGLNRGGLTSVLEAKTRLSHSERDDLYDERVNPIASFPNEGIVVWGQKTLQGRASALDRVNIRRLLIKLKKFIASASRYIVFEQNTSATRTAFLNITEPFLETVQQQSGLSAFRVVMDDTNNTPDVVDRNRLVGQIYIQPTRTAEFIVLDFVIQPTGASFSV